MAGVKEDIRIMSTIGTIGSIQGSFMLMDKGVA